MLPRPESPPPEAQLLKNLKSFSSITAALPDHPSKAAVFLSHRRRLWLIVAVLSIQLILLLSARSIPSRRLHRPFAQIPAACTSGRIYVYDLPPMFNKDLVAGCHNLNPWSSRCNALSNDGFGRRFSADLSGIVPDDLSGAWYATDQFAAEVIYHRRMLSHRCRTDDPSAAAAFYVPFYAGLAVGRHLWSRNSTASDRDRDCSALLGWVSLQDTWRQSGGWDHFTVLGRITWDFRRSKDGDWGGGFLYMPGMENVTRLTIERDPWDPLDVGVPYPTGFHPRTAAEVRAWQRFVLSRTRSTLFSFAGAARAGFPNDFRGLLLDECRNASAACKAVGCGGGRCGGAEILGVFLESAFCLQPRGDSFTRRSMFDCMVAGAIPVVFWRRSAYVQYEWFLPGGREEGEWSVFVERREVRSGAVRVKEVLEGIGEARVRAMRERVVEMIPRLVYAAAEHGLGEGMEDAFDVAVEGVLRRFRDRRGSWGKGRVGGGGG